MGTITFTQNVTIKSGKTSTGISDVFQKDFEINPADTVTITDWSEDMFHRFSVPAGEVDMQIYTGTLDLIKLIVIKPEADLTAKLINANGTSQDIIFNANRLSILHVNFTGFLVSNPTSLPTRGIFYVAGD